MGAGVCNGQKRALDPLAWSLRHMSCLDLASPLSHPAIPEDLLLLFCVYAGMCTFTFRCLGTLVPSTGTG